MSYDPAYLNTASCRSAITYIDGDAGILRYRGYPIEQVAEKASFLETAYLLLEGELPDGRRARGVGGRRPRPHLRPRERHRSSSRGSATTRTRWGCCSARSARSRPSIRTRRTSGTREPRLQRVRLIAKMPTIAAFVFRHSRGLPYVLPAQRPRLHRQLRQHDVRDRRPSRAEPGAPARARDPADPPRRPRAELLDERRARRRLLARRPVLGRLGRHRGALRPAPRRRQRGRAADARRDRRRRATCRRSSRRSRRARAG